MIGTTSVSAAADTIIPSRTASVSGRLMVNIEPLPGWELIETRPPSAWIDRLTTSMPTPRPTVPRPPIRREPRQEDQVVGLVVRKHRRRRDETLVDRDLAHNRAIDPGAVVADLDHDPSGPVHRRDTDHAFRGLPGRGPVRRLLDAVVDRIADHVRERIRQALDDGLVDLGIFSFRDERHGLAGLRGDLANEARQFLENGLHRLRPDCHDAVLDLVRQLFEFLEAQRDLGAVRQPRLAGALGEHGLMDHEFADEIDQAVDALEIDTDRGRGHGGGLPAFGVARGRRVRRGCDVCGGDFGLGLNPAFERLAFRHFRLGRGIAEDLALHPCQQRGDIRVGDVSMLASGASASIRGRSLHRRTRRFPGSPIHPTS